MPEEDLEKCRSLKYCHHLQSNRYSTIWSPCKVVVFRSVFIGSDDLLEGLLLPFEVSGEAPEEIGVSDTFSEIGPSTLALEEFQLSLKFIYRSNKTLALLVFQCCGFNEHVYVTWWFSLIFNLFLYFYYPQNKQSFYLMSLFLSASDCFR